MLEMLRDESGQGLVEYALIVSFVAIACIAAVKLVGAHTVGLLSSTAALFPG